MLVYYDQSVFFSCHQLKQFLGEEIILIIGAASFDARVRVRKINLPSEEY